MIKIVAGFLILVSIVSTFDLGRRKHGINHRHRHHHRNPKYDYADDGGNSYGNNYTVYKTCKRSGMVALTFDDGVVEETSQILDTLSKYGLSATFFVVGYTIEQTPMYRKVLHRIIDEGHTLGTHTMNHADLTQLGPDGIKYELDAAGDLIEGATGERPKLLRPPYGYVSDEVLRVAKRMGYDVVNWNLDTNDWRLDYDTTPIINSLYAADTGSMDSKIVLMHDRPVTVQALESVIKFYQRKGYEFVNMERCLGVKGYF